MDEISRKMVDEEPVVIEETINEAVRQAFLSISPQHFMSRWDTLNHEKVLYMHYIAL